MKATVTYFQTLMEYMKVRFFNFFIALYEFIIFS